MGLFFSPRYIVITNKKWGSIPKKSKLCEVAQPRSGRHQYQCTPTHRASKRNTTLTLSELRKFKKERAETRKRMESINKSECNVWCRDYSIRYEINTRAKTNTKRNWWFKKWQGDSMTSPNSSQRRFWIQALNNLSGGETLDSLISRPSYDKNKKSFDILRVCLHGGGGPQVGDVIRFGGVTRLPI